MKLLFQITLLSLLVIISFIFYNKYLKETKIVEINNNKEAKIQENKNEESNKIDENQLLEKEDTKDKENLIKNLKYSVELADSGKYEISSNLSRLIFENDTEIVFMKNVSAIFTDKNNKKVFINSNIAEFNSQNYDTLFSGNIRIKYEDNLITSEKLHFNFIENNILVYENVIYKGLNGKMQTDNIKIDLLSKNIEIFMNEKSKNVKIMSF